MTAAAHARLAHDVRPATPRRRARQPRLAAPGRSPS